MNSLSSGLGSSLLSSLQAWLSFLRSWLAESSSSPLAGPDSSPYHIPSEKRVQKRKNIIQVLWENISLLAKPAVDTITFPFSAGV